MSEKFDPATHKFGMAYYYKEGQSPETIFYPTCWSDDGFNVYGHMPCAPNKDTKLFEYNLTRAPEHDLIPRADLAPPAPDIDALNILRQDENEANCWNEESWMRGWNKCIDHLASTGYLAQPTDDARAKALEWIDFVEEAAKKGVIYWRKKMSETDEEACNARIEIVQTIRQALSQKGE